MRKIVEVAVGVLYGPQKKSVLISSRPQGKVCAGMWEFPGGKIESEETPAQALIRELAEELDVTCRSPVPWFVMEHEYPHAHVRLHFLRVFDFSGEPRCLEQQSFAWVNEKTLPQPQLLLPMVELVVKRAFLPDVLVTVENADSDWMPPAGVCVGVVDDSAQARDWAQSRGFELVDIQMMVQDGLCAMLPAAQQKLCAVIDYGQKEVLAQTRVPCYVRTDRAKVAQELQKFLDEGAQGAAIQIGRSMSNDGEVSDVSQAARIRCQ